LEFLAQRKVFSLEVIFIEIPTKGLKEGEIAKIRNEKMDLVFQFHYLLPEITLLEKVMLPMVKKDFPKKENKSKSVLLGLTIIKKAQKTLDTREGSRYNMKLSVG